MGYSLGLLLNNSLVPHMGKPKHFQAFIETSQLACPAAGLNHSVRGAHARLAGSLPRDDLGKF